MSLPGPAVLILSWEYPPIVEGGLARHVGRLAPGLVARGIEVHVLTRGDRVAPAEEDLAGVHIHRMPEPHWPSDPDRFAAWVGRMNDDLLAAGTALTERFAFDLIHGHDWLVAGAAQGLADLIDRPLVMTIHATEYGRHQGWIVGQPQTQIHRAERRVVHRAARVIACSDYMRGHIADVFGLDERRITTIPNGVDPVEPVDPAGAAALRGRFARPDQPLVLLVGRLVYEKGFQIALDALPGLIALVPGLRFVVAGSGIHQAELEAQALRLGLGRHGSFLGWVGDDLLRSLYRIADVCVVPSIYEPCGLVALEAMSAGCACVVADTGGLREVVPDGEAGLRFTSRDPQALAAAVARLLEDEPLRARLVAGAAQWVLGFDWASVAAATAALYGDVSASPGPDSLWPMSGPDDLDALSSAELHERAVALAKHRLDVRFFWRLFESVPEARAIAGELDTADVQRASSWLFDLRNADAALDDALRPLYVDYLLKHEKPAS